MAFSGYSTMSGLPYACGSVINSQGYSEEHIPMEYGNGSWDLNLVDPSLRNTGNTFNCSQEWDGLDQPLQRFLGEPQKVLFTAGHKGSCHTQSLHFDFNRPHEALGPIPYVYEASRGSPPSTCSSITSPGNDSDFFHEASHTRLSLEDASTSRSTSQIIQTPSNLQWQYGNLPLPQIGHIQLSQVQEIPDPIEVTFHDEVCYMEMETKMEYDGEIENRTIKQERSRSHYGHSSDERTRASLKSEGSPELGVKHEANEDAESDIDAEGEEVDEMDEEGNEHDIPTVEEEQGDSEYTPEASRSRRRRSSGVSPSSPSNKRNKITKSASRTKSQFTCKTCAQPAKDMTALHKHIASAHTRPYTCTFSFAGCQSTFGNKNEWKRHVSSQHLSLKYWLCDVDACGRNRSKANSPKSGPSKTSSSTSASNPAAKTGGNEFNRKDLFTQHLRRMHAPSPVKRQSKKNAEWEDRVKALQSSCLKTRREPPLRTKCPVRTCAQVFEGPTSWDERMEHVGRHLEKITAAGNGGGKERIEQESDEFMIEWAVRERIIEERVGGGFRLCGDGGLGDEADAEGEGE
jgi:hypothetical protein